jgi:hypothetical protein
MSLARAYAAGGRDTQARALLDELAESGGPWRVGTVQAALGEVDLAFEWLERAIDQNVGQIADMLIMSIHEPLRAQPDRWAALLRRAGFPEDLIATQLEVH